MDASADSLAPMNTRYKQLSPLTDTRYDNAGDLSISELSSSNASTSSNANARRPPQPQTQQQPFSLLARPKKPSPGLVLQGIFSKEGSPKPSAVPAPAPVAEAKPVQEEVAETEVEAHIEDEGEKMAVDTEEGEETVHGKTRARSTSGASAAGEDTRMAASVSKTREERLRHDLFVMRKLNDAFAVYNDSLGSAKSATERVAEQLSQTNALLDKYVDILVQSETATKMIFDERWHGAEEDEAALERIEAEKAERERQEAEQRALEEQREAERREKEEREREAREEKERAEIAKKEKLAMRAGYGGSRGRIGAGRGARRATGSGTSSSARGGAARGSIRGTTPNPTTSGSGGRGSVSRGSTTRGRGIR